MSTEKELSPHQIQSNRLYNRALDKFRSATIQLGVFVCGVAGIPFVSDFIQDIDQAKIVEAALIGSYSTAVLAVGACSVKNFADGISLSSASHTIEALGNIAQVSSPAESSNVLPQTELMTQPAIEAIQDMGNDVMNATQPRWRDDV